MGITADRAPLATYRVQLGPHLSLEQLTGLLIYFRDLGISHLYLSPCLRAAAGSPHGYDMVDPTEVNPELGGLEGFERLCAAAAALGMGLVIDIVPNHMAAAGRQNRWWWDVLAKGRRSAYAGFFDIRWEHPDPRLGGKVMIPVLGCEIERCLETRQIQVRRRGPEVFLAYFEHEFPVSARSLLDLLLAAPDYGKSLSPARLAEMLAAGSSPDDGGSVCGPPPVGRAPMDLNELDDAATAALDAAIASVNADSAQMQRFMDLQHYRLAFWRRANQDLNYRRFFDIHQLAGVCVEKDPTDCVIPRRIWSACRRRRLGFGSSWRKFWSQEKPLPPSGRSPGPPDMIFSTWSTGCLSTPTARAS